MICYVLAMGKQHLGPHLVVGYGIKIFWPGLFITSPDHLVGAVINNDFCSQYWTICLQLFRHLRLSNKSVKAYANMLIGIMGSKRLCFA